MLRFCRSFLPSEPVSPTPPYLVLGFSLLLFIFMFIGYGVQWRWIESGSYFDISYLYTSFRGYTIIGIFFWLLLVLLVCLKSIHPGLGHLREL